MTPDPDPDALRKLAEEALALAEKATRGPWHCALPAEDDSPEYNQRASVEGSATGNCIFDGADDFDAAFIAHARTSLPALASAFIASSARVKELEIALGNGLFFIREWMLRCELQPSKPAMDKLWQRSLEWKASTQLILEPAHRRALSDGSRDHEIKKGTP